ncbi:MAG: SMP-30/gluconolactonase/LRE family protein [Vicinamibacterales bacterium]
MRRVAVMCAAAFALAQLASLDATPAAERGLLDGRPEAIVDLDTASGLQLVRGEWRYEDAPVGAAVKPVGAVAFDDAQWPIAPAGTLQQRRTAGGTAFAWYRLSFTMPARVGRFDTAGSTVAFEIVVDDYAEVWVDGQLPRRLGQSGGALVAGFNAPNRVVVTRNARPGAEVRIAVFAANGPLSDPPANRIWVRSATLDFYRTPAAESLGMPVEVTRADPGLDAVVPPGTRLEKLAGGFSFVEGPVWVAADESLLFSDPNDNRIYRWSADDGVSVFRTKSGYTGVDIGEYHQPGSNGLTLDAEGRLTIAEHGNRRITRLEKNGDLTVLADRFEGKRLNSPNDLVYRSDGSLYFSDPYFGLPEFEKDRRAEQPSAAVYRRAPDGRLTQLATELKGPNGLAFSPDERVLYVSNWDERRKVIMAWDVAADGSITNGRVFADMTAAPGEEALDGLKVDRAGNVFVSGPGGLWVWAPDGRQLGIVRLPELAANMAWGDTDGRTLYLTARTGLYRLRLATPGPPPHSFVLNTVGARHRVRRRCQAPPRKVTILSSTAW